MDNQDDHKVFEKQKLCIQEEAPYCNDVCPLGVDARALARLTADGKLEGAFSEYRKRVIFPQIVSRYCSAPCQDVCPRREIEDSIQIRMLERACVEHGYKPAPKAFIPARKGTAHIIGASLAGLAGAHSLARKGFTVHLYEKTGRPGGWLWALVNQSDEEAVAADIAQGLDFSKLHLHLETLITSSEQVPDGCVMVACGGFEWLESDRFFTPDTLNRQASSVEEIAAGKLAATQMELALKGEPLTPPPDRETTRLVIPPLDQFEKRPATRPAKGEIFSRDEAEAEASRCLQCQCLACTRTCLLLKQGGSYPKNYINHAQQSLRTIKQVHRKMAARRTNACNLCGLCGEICPNGLNMAEVYQNSRRIMHQGGQLPEAFHEFWLRDLAFSQSDEAYLSRSQPGHKRAEWLFFPGCQMGGSLPEYVIDTYRFLAGALDGGVALHVGCCGAPSEWAGYSEVTAPVLKDFRDSWEELGQPRVILACPSCEKIFQTYHPDILSDSLWSVLAQKIPVSGRPAEGLKAALFDPCSSRFNPEEQQSVRRLLAALGCRVEELPLHGRQAQCCGYGGLIYASNRDLANDIRDDRMEASDLPYVTYCVNCREVFADGGKPVWHVLDFLFGRCGEERARQKPPDWSTRRANRLRLKIRLLQELWGEDMERRQLPHEDLTLLINDELRARMGRELIMIDDIKLVVHQAEHSGEKLVYDDGRMLAHLKIGHNTYWAEYVPEAGGYRLCNAYAHRMRIKEASDV